MPLTSWWPSWQADRRVSAFGRHQPDEPTIGNRGSNLLDRAPRPFSGSSYEDQQGIERIDPEIIGLPPSGISQQVGIDATMDHGGRGDGVLALVVLILSGELVLRKESIPDVLEIDRFSRGGPGLIDGIGSELEQLFGRKRVVSNV